MYFFDKTRPTGSFSAIGRFILIVYLATAMLLYGCYYDDRIIESDSKPGEADRIKDFFGETRPDTPTRPPQATLHLDAAAEVKKREDREKENLKTELARFTGKGVECTIRQLDAGAAGITIQYGVLNNSGGPIYLYRSPKLPYVKFKSADEVFFTYGLPPPPTGVNKAALKIGETFILPDGEFYKATTWFDHTLSESDPFGAFAPTVDKLFPKITIHALFGYFGSPLDAETDQYYGSLLASQHFCEAPLLRLFIGPYKKPPAAKIPF